MRTGQSWMHYVNDIIASDVASAVFLSSWMRHTLRAERQYDALELIDLQRYKVFRKGSKVRTALRKARTPHSFLFLVGKN